MALDSPMGRRLEVVGWRDSEDPYGLVATMLSGAARLGVGDRMWASHLLGLERSLDAGELVATSAAVPLLRAVKDSDELGLLERAGLGADEAFDEVLELGFLGATEWEIGERLDALLREHAHDDVNFTIVGSGPNGASPHHRPTDRRIGRGDPVVLDF